VQCNPACMAVRKHYINEVRVRRLARSSSDLSTPTFLQETVFLRCLTINPEVSLNRPCKPTRNCCMMESRKTEQESEHETGSGL
jgi:hypothetical protein